MTFFRHSFIALAFMALLLAGPVRADTAKPVDPVLSVFDAPILQTGLLQIRQLLKNDNLDQAITLTEQLIERYPAAHQYMVVRAVLAVQQKDGKGALSWLHQAASAGYRDFARLEQEPAFKPLRKAPAFAAITSLVKKNAAGTPDPAKSKAPRRIARRNPEARIGEDNVVWDARRGVFLARFTAEKSALDSVTGKKRKDPVSRRLRDLYRSGKAAGNRGDIYDNRDRGHSVLSRNAFPQIAHVIYSPAAQSRNMDISLNRMLMVDRPLIGNASLGVGGQGSLAGMAYQSLRQVNFLQLQYLANHLYVYPAVYDYAPKPQDKFTAHTPYLVVSKGKSGSDRPFLEAMATGLAALPPAVKAAIIEKRQMAPVLQYLLRHGQRHVTGKASYLSPAAHPVVMDGAALDPSKIIDLAQALRVDTLPLRPDMVILQEDGKQGNQLVKGQPGFTLPNAINRHLTWKDGVKRMRISAALTEKQVGADGGEKPVYHWVLLEGDPNNAFLSPRGARNMILDISLPWRPPGPALNGEKVTGSRTDIGLFAERDGVISAPSIISIWSVPE